ncbi:MAG: S8 family serine peptidase [Bdellovibrionaceae bacterium]|nr:S8 family serine peptidase [Pseudobdellovibrionaceae bacterium]
MKTKSLLFVSIVFSQMAIAERYMVTFKNHDLHQELVSRKDSNLQLQSYMNSQGYTLTVDRIETHLQALDTVVVKHLSDLEVQSLKKNRNVLFVEKEVKHPLPFPLGQFKKPVLDAGAFRFFEQDRPWGIGAINSGRTWNVTAGGAGARVLILDTGIDRDHPAIRPNLENAKDFVGDQQDGYAYKDTIGHGTHVAGTVAGVLDKSGFSGVAPTAHILAGRVCAEDGCSNISIAEGINWGVEQKVDVISMSLGGMWSSMAERIAVKRAFDAGITIVAASGNDGSSDVSFPAALPECIAVGAVDADMKRAEFSQYGPELAVVAPGVDVISSVPLASGREAMVKVAMGGGDFQKTKSSAFEGSKTLLRPVSGQMIYVGLGKEDDFTNLNVEGKIALIKRGELTFREKVDNAIKAKAAAVIIFNNTTESIRGSLTDDGSEVSVGVFMVDLAAGDAMMNALKEGQVVQTQMITAITNHASMNGTSMATPHVSGVVALMKSVNKALTPTQVKALLKATAKKISDDTENETGSGVVQADLAVQAALAVAAGQIIDRN